MKLGKKDLVPTVSTLCSRYVVSDTCWYIGYGDFKGIPGSLAHDCLLSMPFRRDLALRFLDQYMGYLQFQSTVVTLKSTYNDTLTYILSNMGLSFPRCCVRLPFTHRGRVEWLESNSRDGHEWSLHQSI